METTAEETQSSTALVVVNDLTPMQLFAPGKIRSVVDQIRAKVLAIETDISTSDGRKQIASLAYKVSRTKTFLDDAGKGLVADEKKRLAKIDEERAMVRQEMDALRDEVRKPLTDWENAEKARLDDNEMRLLSMGVIASESYLALDSVDKAQLALDRIFNHNFEEFTKRAAAAHEKALLHLDERRKQLVQEAADRAEQKRQEAERKERERIERENRIAAEAKQKAEEAAERRRQADERAAKQREEEQARVAAEEKARLERDKADAEERARKADAGRKAAEAKAERDRVLAAEKAAKELREAAEKSELDRKQAQANAERERVLAVEAERKRQEDGRRQEQEQRLAKLREEERRAKDRAHRADIHGQIAMDIDAALQEDLLPGLDHLPAVERIVAAIANGKVRHVTVNY